MAVYWALLLMDCAEDVTKLTHGVNLFTSRRGGWEQSPCPAWHTQWKTKGHMVFLWEDTSVSRRLGHHDLTPSLSVLERDLRQTCRFTVPVISSNCCFKAVFLMAPFRTLPSGFKGTCCTWICVGVYLFLYCTFKHEYVSVFCKTKKGDRQRRA